MLDPQPPKVQPSTSKVHTLSQAILLIRVGAKGHGARVHSGTLTLIRTIQMARDLK